MADRNSTLTFVAKDSASGVVKQLDANLGKLGVSGGAAGKQLGGLGSIVGGITPAFLGTGLAIGAVVGFLGGAVKAAADEEVGIKRLGQSLQANVPAWNGNTAAIESLIAKREKLAFSDGDLRDSLARIVAVTHDVAKAQDIQGTAMDLARFKGISLADASDALIKVEGGQYRALKSLGIVLKEGATQTDALAAVQRVAAGQAEAFGNTTQGAMEAAGIAVQDLTEDIGAALAPVIKTLAETITTTVLPALRQIGEVVIALGPVIIPVLEAVAVLIGVKLVASLAAAVASFAQGAIGAAGFGAAATAAGAEAAAAGTAAEVAANAAKTSWLGLAVGVAAASAASKGSVDGFKDSLHEFYNENIHTQQAATGLSAAMAEGKTRFDANRAAAQKVAAAYVITIEKALGLRSASDGVAKSFAGQMLKIDDATEATERHAKAAQIAHLRLLGEKDGAISAALALQGTGAASNAAAAGANTNSGALSVEAAWLDRVAFKATVAARNLAAMSATEVAANNATRNRLRGLGEDPGAGASGSLVRGGVNVAPFDQTFAPKDPGLPGIDPIKSRGGGGGSSGAGAASAAATAAAKAIGSAFTSANAVADKFFESVHNSNLKAIKDAHDRATAEIAAERKAVDARLNERKRLNAEPVTAAEKALSATEHQQQERNLRESLAAAQAGTTSTDANGATTVTVDERAVRDANEALSNFLAQASIDSLREAQAAADAKAEQDAANEQRALDKKQATADRTEVLATAAEDKRYNALKRHYDAEATQLETHLTKIKATHAEALKAINALYDEFLVGVKAKGKSGTTTGTADAASATAPITINVNGVSDPDEVARRVVLALQRETARQGVTV